MPKGQNEAFSRVLIDKALEFSGWDLLDPKQVVFELHGGAGRSDYLLKDKLGRTLCVLEAKRETLDPYDAKEQARGYAENLNAPFILLSNGREHWFWNFQRADQRDAYPPPTGANGRWEPSHSNFCYFAPERNNMSRQDY
jgi:type I site-specific restriction endonuclease